MKPIMMQRGECYAHGRYIPTGSDISILRFRLPLIRANYTMATQINNVMVNVDEESFQEDLNDD